jgi:hypothetical protein
MEPYLERSVEECVEDAFDAVGHHVTVDLFDRRTERLRIDLPVGSGIEVFMDDAANFASGAVGVGYAPLRVEHENAVGKILDERSERRLCRGGRGISGTDSAQRGVLSHICVFRVLLDSDSRRVVWVG